MTNEQDPMAKITPKPLPTEISLSSYLKMDEELTSLLHRKRELDRHMAGLESQIYNLEGRYLEETAVDGNVAIGFSGYMAVAQGNTSQQQQQTSMDGVFGTGSGAFSEADRIFSNASTTYRKHMKEWELGTAAGYRKRKKKPSINASGDASENGNHSSSARGESSSVDDA